MSKRNRLKRLARKEPAFFIDDPTVGASTFSNAGPTPAQTLETISAAVEEMMRLSETNDILAEMEKGLFCKIGVEAGEIRLERIDPQSIYEPFVDPKNLIRRVTMARAEFEKIFGVEE